MDTPSNFNLFILIGIQGEFFKIKALPISATEFRHGNVDRCHDVLLEEGGYR
jgi:hypothetical protein